MIEAPSDKHLWAESYDRDVSSVVQLQDDVARTVAREIALKLTPQEKTRLVQAHPANIEAYEAYLRGRYFWNLRTVDGLKKGKEYFEQAIQKDADYAPAYAGLADSLQSDDLLGGGLDDPGCLWTESDRSRKQGLAVG